MTIDAEARCTGDSYDVVIIGGGINGASAARELSAHGYRVLLAEMADFANGASSRSSRILHCGLRYFETDNPVWTFLSSPRRLAGAVGMARAAMVARSELSAQRPANCKPFKMCFPVYEGDHVKGWHLDVGFALLARLGPQSPPLDYRRLTGDFENELPLARDLRDAGKLRSIATYREYIIDSPDRLCVDAGLEAERNGAALRLFTKAALAGQSPDGRWRVQLSSENGEEVVTAPVVLALAGAWLDELVACPDAPPQNPLVTGTKGSHFVARLPSRYAGHGIACLHRGGMPLYCLPLDGDLFYIGPTETLYEGDPGKAVATDEDLAFLLDEANFLLPGLGLTRSQIEFTWAGVRPLTFDPQLPMGRRTREIHDLTARGMPGVFAMTAGPVMSHLSAGRALRDVVSRRLKPSGTPRPPNGDPALSRPQAAAEPSREEILRRSVLVEHARDLRGILYTRTGLAWGRLLDRPAVERAAQTVADLLRWSPRDVSEQVESFLRFQEANFTPGKKEATPASQGGGTRYEEREPV